jgi:carbon-monoxide dehydrogenase small subunit
MGICGSCTVLLEGRPVSSCLLLAVQAEGQRITTIEGLERDGKLHPVQEAFLTHAAVQCGYCTPGFVLTAKALLDEKPAATRDEVLAALEGNLCRCTGYVKIIDAVLAVARRQPSGAATRGTHS